MSPRAGLDRAAVVEAAAKMTDDAGEVVTLAGLASRLGVRAPSLYNHVDGQAGLRRELALFGVRDLLSRIVRASVGKVSSDALVAVSQEYREFALDHPGIYPLTQAAPDPDDAELAASAAEIVEVLGTLMESFGLEGDTAVHAIRGLRSLLHGFVMLETTGGFGIPLDIDESFERAVRTFILGLHYAEEATESA
ncbi:MAG: WHG domain-containing protein [Thermomicrobiales bacterium]